MSRQAHTLRRLSLVLLVLWLVVLGVSFAHRQMRRRSMAVETDPVPAGRSDAEQPVRMHRGLVYTDTLGIEPNFRVAARETLEFASGWYELKDVEVSIFHAGEVAYGLVASDARFNPQLRQAHAHGNAQLSLSRGVAVRADGFDVRGGDRSFTSRGAVTFAAAGWGGVAGGVSGSAGENVIELHDNVTASWRGGEGATLMVLAPRVTYHRGRGLIALPDGVIVLQGQNQLTAASGRLQLRGIEGPPEGAMLAGGVTINTLLEGGAALQVRGEEVELRLGENGGVDFAVQPEAGTGWVQGRWVGADGAVRVLTALRVVGSGQREEGLQWVEGQGTVCVMEAESGADQPLHLRSDSMRVDFANGRPNAAAAWGEVRVESGPQWSEGDRLVVTLATRRSLLLPAPGGRVSFGSDTLQGRADRLETDPQIGVTAEGAVSGTVVRSKVLGGEEGPVRFAAARAVSSHDRKVLILEGDARLWQGERLVRADRLEYRPDEEVVTGRGNVVTVGPAPRRGDGTSGELVRIAARLLTWEARTSIAVFEGDVRLADDQADVAAQRVLVTFAPGGRVLLATFEGGVSVRERGSARAVTGQRARLEPEQDLLELWGDPLLITEPTGNQVKAAHLVWKRQTGVLTIRGGAESRSETLYHPGRPPATPRGPRPQEGGQPSTR